MSDVSMPRLSDSMEEGTILKWLKSDGDEISKGDELVEIETDKANMTYESDVAGVLEIVAKEGATLPVGDVIARIGEGGGDGAKPAAKEEDEGDEEEPSAEEDEDGGEEEEPAGDEEEDRADDEEGSEDEEEDKEEEEEEEAAEDEREPEPAAEGEAEAKGEADASGEAEAAGEEKASGEATAERDRSAEGNGAAPAGDGRIKASPVARRMAREMGLSLEGLEGTGPGGRIVKADIEAAAKEGGAPAKAEEEPVVKDEPAPAEEKRDVPPPVVPSGDRGGTAKGDTDVQELSKLQQTVARRMAESKATAPDFVLTAEVEMDQAVEFRKQLKALAGDAPAPSFNDFVVKAAALALRDFPRANGAYRDGKFELYSRVNVGIAVAGQDSLVVPTLFDADRKSLGEIARESCTVAERVRAGAITPPELSGATFTVSNLGMFGIKRFVAVINPPQAAILAVGEMEPRPVVRDGDVTVRTMMELTLSCDHRILYGADAAEFLGKIRERLEQPLLLAL